MIDRQCRSAPDVLIVGVRHDADDAARQRLAAEVRIGPPHLPVQRLAVREEPLRDALADDHHRLRAAAVLVGEIAPGEHRDADHGEEARRHNAEPRARILFAIRRRVTLDREWHSRAETAGIAPGHEASDRDAVHAGQLGDAPRRFLIKVDDLGIPDAGARRRRRDIEDQHVPHVVAGVRRLQGDERGEEHARAGEQNERARNLGHREYAQAAIGARRDPHAAVRQALRRRQARDEREQDGGGHRQAGADPEHA